MRIIYEPRGRAREYAPLAVNLYTSCTHGCAYCYAPSTMQMKKDDFHAEARTRKDALKLFERDCQEYAKNKMTDPVLMSFVSDPYQPEEDIHRLTRRALMKAAEYGVPIHILTKGGCRAVADFPILKDTGPGAAFATTLTYLDKKPSLEIEPRAALPESRFRALRVAHELGIKTWVSFEPALSFKSIITFIRKTHGFVDLYKVGHISRMNELSDIKDWRFFAETVISELEKYGKDYIIKNDLKRFLED